MAFAHIWPRVALVLTMVLLNQDFFVSGHTVLYNPLSYNPIHCKPPECPGPMPPVWKTGESKARNSEGHPAAWWKRGLKVRVKWHRNNHGGGFVRFSLVPLSKMHNHKWHAYTAFHYGCFESRLYNCKGFTACGSDEDGYGYYQTIQIPDVFPDGKYVFSMVWYGGVKYDRVNAKYSNYYSASHVRIYGGNRVAKWYQPVFAPVRSSYLGEQGEPVPKGLCLTASTWVGECKGGQHCEGRKAVASVPGNFKNGLKPDGILSYVIQKALDQHENS